MFDFLYRKKVLKLMKDYEKVLFFIGSGRTGSTLVGQLINYHPECLIGNEYNIARKVIEESKEFDKEIIKMAVTAYVNFNKGFSAKATNRFQNKWNDFSEFAKEKSFEKKRVSLIGDKIGGRLNTVFVKNPDKLADICSNINNLYFLNIIRNPIDTAKSFLKSHSHEVKTFDKAIDKVLYNYFIAFKISKHIPASNLTIYYEDLQQNPKKILIEIFTWLGLEVSDEWLSNIIEKIDSSIRQNEISQIEKEITVTLLRKYELNIIQEKYNL